MLYLYFKFGVGVLLGKPRGRPNVYSGRAREKILRYDNTIFRQKRKKKLTTLKGVVYCKFIYYDRVNQYCPYFKHCICFLLFTL